MPLCPVALHFSGYTAQRPPSPLPCPPPSAPATFQKAAEASRAPRQSGMALHTAERLRKYLAAGEREAFLWEAEQAHRADRTRCMTLAYAGCRLSELWRSPSIRSCGIRTPSSKPSSASK